jgi:hypothetical protein
METNDAVGQMFLSIYFQTENGLALHQQPTDDSWMKLNSAVTFISHC